MKIIHISTGFPLSFQGGITNYVRNLAKKQAENGHEVWVLSGPDNNKESDLHYKEYSSSIRPFSLKKAVDKKSLLELERFLAKEKFDIIHIHMMLDIDWDLYNVIKNYRYIVSLHDYFYLCPRIQMVDIDGNVCKTYDKEKCRRCVKLFDQYRYTNAIKRRLKKYFNIVLPDIESPVVNERFEKMKKLLEGAKMLLPVSKRVMEIYEESGILNTYKVLHIGNSSADKFSDVAVRYKKTSGRIKIAMLSSLSHIKGGDLYIRFAKEFDSRKYEFHFWGRTDILQIGDNKSNIIYHGAYKQDQLSGILSDVDIGMVLSIWEDNGPQVVMEFLNNRIPVVGTKMGGIPDFVIDGENGFLFDPYNPAEIDRVIDYFNHEFTYDKLSILQHNIKHTKTPSEHYDDMMEVYQEVLGDSIY